jgi:small redox-active disulfide protein 2
MEIKILGFGCNKCNKLYKNTLDAVQQLHKDVNIVRIENAQEIASYNTFFMPVLLVNNSIVSKGKVLSVKEIVSLLSFYS